MSHGFSEWLDRTRTWVRGHVPPGLRLVLGLLLILGGFLGFLPVLGFWMIPLGLVIAGLDAVPLWRWLTAWVRKSRKEDP